MARQRAPLTVCFGGVPEQGQGKAKVSTTILLDPF